MEKIININFQGRVIPIEESAYDSLKQYTDSLRRHFASEESSDEIISDIENRIAELLTNRLKQGVNCINSSDLDKVIDSIGRLEDIEAAEAETNTPPVNKVPQPEPAGSTKERFHRNADDKVIAGVCSGIAQRMNIDPVVVRIIFVLLFVPLFWIYILLWIIVPSQSLSTNITRRLFRNPDDRVIAGVAGGLAQYFKIDSWKVRIVFVLPLILGLGFRIFGHQHFGFGWDASPILFGSSLNSALFILYVILWIALPYATSSTDKMEMRGEKIDINSIKAATQARVSKPERAIRSFGHVIGRTIGILFKSFFLFIGGIIALSFFAALIGLVFAGTATVPFTNFLFDSGSQYTFAWIAVVLALGIPLLALIVWIVRRVMGVRSHRHYLGYVFTGLWCIGIVSALIMAGMVMRNFSARAVTDEPVTMQQPSTGKLYVNVSNYHVPWRTQHGRWFGDWDDQQDAPFHFINNDSMWLNNVRVSIEQSPDSLFHMYTARASRGNTSQFARNLAEHIAFDIHQQDSVVSLPGGFTISSKDKFHNQQVLVTIEVPLGRSIQLSKDIDDYSWYNINASGSSLNYHWDNDHSYRHDIGFVMTASGLRNARDTADMKIYNRDEEDDDTEIDD